MGFARRRQWTLLAGGVAIAGLWMLSRLGPSAAEAASAERPSQDVPIRGVATPAAPPILDPIEPVGTEASPREVQCVRCEELPPEDPRMANLAPVDALLLDDFTGQPIPYANVHVTDQNGVVQKLASDGSGRIVADDLLHAGAVHAELKGTPFTKARRERTLGDRGLEVTHCANWNAPDRWRVPCPALAPIKLSGSLEKQFYYDLLWQDPARRGALETTAAELVPVFACPEGLRDRLHPATTHIAALWPRMGRADDGPELYRDTDRPTMTFEGNSDPLDSPAALALVIPKGLGHLVGTVTIGRPLRAAGAPFALDVTEVPAGDEGVLKERLGPAWAQVVRIGIARHRRFGVNQR